MSAWPDARSWSAYRPPTRSSASPPADVFDYGGSPKSSWYDDCLPERDIPTLLDLYRQGRGDPDVFVSETIGIDRVNEAFEKMRAGRLLRSVVLIR